MKPPLFRAFPARSAATLRGSPLAIRLRRGAQPLTSRRAVLIGGIAAALTGALIRRTWSADPAPTAAAPGTSPGTTPAQVSIEEFAASGKSLGKVQVNRVIKTEAQWR